MKTIDLEKLPEEARKELLDFYEFLLQKYKKKENKNGKKLSAIKIKTKNFKFSREEAEER
ncbi:DUF2281 domain-containing protein [Persephonella sp.]|jgi:hypothetical protein